MTEVQACRTCGTAIYLSTKSDGPIVGGTGRDLNEHWRHIRGDHRYCDQGNGAIAEPYDESGPIYEELRLIQLDKSRA